jgi:hypothetical protein
MVRNKVNGPPTDGRPYWSTNGWIFWHYKDPVTGHSEPISKWLESLVEPDSCSCWEMAVTNDGWPVVNSRSGLGNWMWPQGRRCGYQG